MHVNFFFAQKVLIKEENDCITIEGHPIESDRKDSLVKLPKSNGPCACVLCRLNLYNLNYTVRALKSVSKIIHYYCFFSSRMF